ncbi:ladinin-1 [Pelobates fuscus]|uniref:ladinin-1 n=1 Tax=Pelobates fuscus TaxID=191477 RepID=UPI002FE458FE
MSVSRSNWSALSRLAKQWSEDDEEEQIRERRRRNRVISNPAERIIEVFADEGLSSDLSPVPNVIDSINLKMEEGSILREALQNRAQENPTNGKKPKEDKPYQFYSGGKKSNTREILDEELPKTPVDETNLSTSKTEGIHGPTNKDGQSSRCKSQICWGEKNQGRIFVREDTQMLSQKQNNTAPEKQTQGKQKEAQVINQNTSSNRTYQDQIDGIFLENPNSNMITCGQDSSSIPGQTNNSSVPVSISSPPQDSTKSSFATSASTGNLSRYRSQVFVSSVKIPRQRSGTSGRQHVLSPPPVPEKGSLSFLKMLNSTEVQITTLPSTSQNSKKSENQEPQMDTKFLQDENPTSPQAASSFRRFSPQTSSFRVLSQNEDRVTSGRALTRSSSLRISLRSQKFEDRLDKYTAAAQRPGNVRIPVLNRSTTGASEGIASKKSVFERREISTGTNITNSRQDIRTGDFAFKRNIWQQRSQSSNDTKL